MKRAIPILGNKYFITSLAFVIWLAFFDRNDIYSQYTTRQKLSQLERDRQYYLDEIKQNKADLFHLTSNPRNLEKFAREKYLMKKDDEDLFVFVKK